MKVWSRPTSPFFKISTRGSTRKDIRRRPSPARTASTSSRLTWQVVAWGGRDVRDRPSLRGDRVRGLSPALVVRRDPRLRTSGQAAGGRGDRRHQPATGRRAGDLDVAV